MRNSTAMTGRLPANLATHQFGTEHGAINVPSLTNRPSASSGGRNLCISGTRALFGCSIDSPAARINTSLIRTCFKMFGTMKSLPMPQSAALSDIFGPNYAREEWGNSQKPFAATVGGTYCPFDDAGCMTHG